MKKTVLYISIAAIVLAIVAVAVLYKSTPKFDNRVTFSYKEKRPYGAYICYNTLKPFFKADSFKVESTAPESWMSFDSVYTNKTLLFILTKQFNPNDYELNKLYDFVSKGNYVFISSLNFNETSRNFFDFQTNYFNNFYRAYTDTCYDSVRLKLSHYKDGLEFENPGYTSNNNFVSYNKNRFSVLGLNKDSLPNLIKAKVNSGAILINTDPFVFSNYFLLHNNNNAYYQKVLSAVPNDVKHIVWDDYYMFRKEDYDSHENDQSLLRVLFKYDGFRYAFWLALALFIVYLLVHMKRRQRFVPIIEPNKNDSLYFAETIGRLYFEKGDHTNLAKKMAAYFLEHVRSRYLINTSNLNNEFIEKLSGKSGYNVNDTEQLIQAVVNVQHTDSITQLQLNELYLLFLKFYKHTN